VSDARAQQRIGYCQVKFGNPAIWDFAKALDCREELLRGEAWMDHFAPKCEAPAHDFPVVPGCQQMPTWTKERCDNAEGREEPLRVPGRLEASHSTFSLPRWLVGTLCAIVCSLVAYVQHIGHYFRLCGGITTKFVGDDGSRNVLQSSQQFAKELLGSLSVPPRLH
jgi:hypothetical protein